MDPPQAPRGRRRIVRALGSLALAAAAVGALAVVRPAVVRQTLTSPRALLLLAALVALTVLLSRTLPRFTANRPVRTVVPWLPVVAALVAFVLPSFQQRTADEDLPGALVPEPAGVAMAAAEQEPAAGVSPSASPGPAVPAAPVRLTSGKLRGADGHDASGTVSSYDVGGELVLRFEDVDIEGTPDPHVYLVPRAGAEDIDGGVRLDDLTAEVGSFNYPLPDGFPTPGGFSVVVWCEAFAVPIAAASQSG